MKRLLLLTALVIFVCGSSYGWGRREHATVAQIAENHLTPKAKKLITKYLGGRSMVYYSCYADDYQPLYIDLGWEPSNYRRMAMFPHTFGVDERGRVPRTIRKGDKYIKNTIYYIDTWSKELAKNHRTMDDSTRLVRLALIIHAVGDMHCPVHIRYHDDQTLGVYKVRYGNKSVDYHRLWDADLVGKFNMWSYTTLARQYDIFTKKQAAEATKGDVYEWGEDAARRSIPARQYTKGAKIDKTAFMREFTPLAEEQICRAGYRLAKLLNDTFK